MKKTGIFLTTLIVAVFGFVHSFSLLQPYYLVIPIEFLNSYQIPCTSIEIEANKYQVEIDLGAKTALSLHKDVLEKMKKKPCGTSRRMDFQGKKYETPLYSISHVKAGHFSLKKVQTQEESQRFVNKAPIIKEKKENRYAGRIGRNFFAGKNIFLDCSHRVLIACKKLEALEKNGYDTKIMIPVPLKTTVNGIVIEIITDFGTKKFVLDTGTTVSAIRSTNLSQQRIKCGLPVVETAMFSIGGIDFGQRELYLLDINQDFNAMDGLLGMDFLKDHAIYLDFVKEIAYISKNPSEYSCKDKP